MAQVVGPGAAVRKALDHGEVDPSVDRLGPLPFRARQPGGPRSGAAANVVAEKLLVQVLLRAPVDRGPALAASLAAMRAGRSARKEKDSVAVRMDPVDGGG